ncbi:MAG: hypothetical protein ACHQ53_09895 [Polyangiales bacterium]
MRSSPARSFHRAFVARIALVLGVAALSACLADEGETCQVDSDCSSGLVCSIAPSTERGVCKTMAAAGDAGLLDAGAEQDADTALPKDAAAGGQDGG